MIRVTAISGGYELRHIGESRERAPFVVRDDELPALLAMLVAHATGETIADWDIFAFLCGNDQVALTRQEAA